MLVRPVVDHLLLGVSDLVDGIDWLEQRTGVRAAIGGVHPGRGTRNALVSLGGACYLEILAPDPAQAASECWFPVRTLREPRLITFAMRAADIDRTATALQRAGWSTIGPSEGARRTATGGFLRWKTLGVESPFRSGEIDPLPFWIEWVPDAIHPATSAPVGCVLEELRCQHPRAEELGAAFREIGITVEVTRGQQVCLLALLQTPKGHLELA
jgi:hypothetical protein